MYDPQRDQADNPERTIDKDMYQGMERIGPAMRARGMIARQASMPHWITHLFFTGSRKGPMNSIAMNQVGKSQPVEAIEDKGVPFPGIADTQPDLSQPVTERAGRDIPGVEQPSQFGIDRECGDAAEHQDNYEEDEHGPDPEKELGRIHKAYIGGEIKLVIFGLQ